jgi:predicted metalloendopeptidase
MDKTVKPANDFFRYVNGTWLDNTEIPSDRTRWGSFDELRKDRRRCSGNIERGSNKSKIQIRYRSRQGNQFVQNDT